MVLWEFSTTQEVSANCVGNYVSLSLLNSYPKPKTVLHGSGILTLHTLISSNPQESMCCWYHRNISSSSLDLVVVNSIVTSVGCSNFMSILLLKGLLKDAAVVFLTSKFLCPLISMITKLIINKVFWVLYFVWNESKSHNWQSVWVV